MLNLSMHAYFLRRICKVIWGRLHGCNKVSFYFICRAQLVFGVTEITRRLEKGMLRLVVVDRSSPWQLHRHLAQLSVVRGCPALALDRMSDMLASFVSVTRMCALGFKVKTEAAFIEHQCYNFSMSCTVDNCSDFIVV